MELPVNRFKRAIVAGQAQVGLWSGLGSANGAELCAAAGFDWLLLDAEHGFNDVLSIQPQLQAVAPYATSAVVRPPVADAALVKRYLDVGAQTLLVPMVDTAEQARLLAAAAAYAPTGMRGMATMTRAARWGRVTDYIKRAREQICLIVQIESVTGMQNLDAIASVDGVDALFIGPADLAASMGHPGQAGHPDVVSAVERAIRRVRELGKPVGILTLDEALAQRYFELGCSFVAVGIDVVILARAVDALRARFKGGTGPTSAY
jgi:4-hydroxy-2-oxoheptanedioate aldolase